MQAQVLAVIRDGIAYAPTGEQISPARAVAVAPVPVVARSQDEPRRETVTKHHDPVDEVAALLARVARIGQSLGEDDARRVRSLVNATCSLLSATTVLPRGDQDLLQRALRNRT